VKKRQLEGPKNRAVMRKSSLSTQLRSGGESDREVGAPVGNGGLVTIKVGAPVSSTETGGLVTTGIGLGAVVGSSWSS
jgi:hypothetical protein